MHVEGLLPDNVGLFYFLRSVQCSQYERFRLQHVQMVNNTSSFKPKLIGNNADASRVNRIIPFDV